MCKICLDQVWIIGLDGALKRCPACSTPRQLSLVEFDAALHAIRLGAMEITEDDDEHIDEWAGEQRGSTDRAPDAGDAIHTPSHPEPLQHANPSRYSGKYASLQFVHSA